MKSASLASASLAFSFCLLTACKASAPVVSDAGMSAGSANAGPGAAPSANAIVVIEGVKVVAKPLNTMVHLEGELSAYERIAVYARMNGFVSSVPVDRGTYVKKGQVLVTLVAPELQMQRAEAEAKLSTDAANLERLKAAPSAARPGAPSEIERAGAVVQADRARVESLRNMEQYLTVTAPFDGAITERNVHPGALVGPAGAADSPMLRLEQVQPLRLTVAVPEMLVGTLLEGSIASFTVRAYPGAKFAGTVERFSRTVDAKSRTMAVEVDVDNTDGRLAAGMSADVTWPAKRKKPSLFVPQAAVVRSADKTFVARIREGVVEQVAVEPGALQDGLVEVVGRLDEGDTVADEGADELRAGMRVDVHAPSGWSP